MISVIVIGSSSSSESGLGVGSDGGVDLGDGVDDWIPSPHSIVWKLWSQCFWWISGGMSGRPVTTSLYPLVLLLPFFLFLVLPPALINQTWHYDAKLFSLVSFPGCLTQLTWELDISPLEDRLCSDSCFSVKERSRRNKSECCISEEKSVIEVEANG